MNMSNLSAANVGSAVRWLITTLGTYFVTINIGTAGDWSTMAAGGAAVAALVWSIIANVKKVA